MQRLLLAVALLLGAAPLGSADRSISAVQKVVQMLRDMSVKAKQEKADEEVSFSKFSTWCENQKGSLAKQIQKEATDIEMLTTEIGKQVSDAKTLGEQIAALQADLSKFEADLKTQTVQREKDHSGFLTEQQDYAESIDALERAINVLNKQDYDRTALVQLADSSSLPSSAQQMVSAFLGMMDDDAGTADPMAYSAPEANAYEFQSGGIVELLKKLETEFTEKKAECEKEEMNSKHAFDMIQQDLTDSIEKAKEDVETMSGQKLSKEEESAMLKKQLSSTTDVKAEDEKTLSDTKVECKEKTLSFEEKQQLRAEEIQALEKAMEILSSEDVQGASLVQKKKGTSLLQVAGAGANADRTAGIRVRVRDFLTSESKRLHSQKLGLLAQKLAADPFAKVKKMIDDMITRLLGEAKEDAEHEGFCDKELNSNKITREKLTETMDGLNADVENGKATITMLTEDIATLSKDVAELSAAREQMTSMRTSEKGKNEATVADAEAAQKAVAAAVEVLKDFYAKSSTATAFIQTATALPTTDWGKSSGAKMGTEEWDALADPNADAVDLGHKEGMQTFGARYAGQQDEAGGVLAMLEVIASDFATLQADTESAEAMAKTAFDDFMAESKKDMAVKSRKIQMNENDKTAAESKLREDTADMKFTQDKLLAADRYYEKLKPQCLDAGMTFDERKGARQDEIASLKEALAILSGEDIA